MRYGQNNSKGLTLIKENRKYEKNYNFHLRQSNKNIGMLYLNSLNHALSTAAPFMPLSLGEMSYVRYLDQ